ncbi:MAG: VUT family protein [Pseudomonadota bacterium]|nr:VUT family protein [Pseudomonadota bacterium]
MWVTAYVAAIVGVNWMFLALPAVATPFGDIYYANFVVGAIFVLRDYAQRQISHYILLATLLAGILTYRMVDPTIAVASLTAFFLSESVDWAIFSFTRRPLQERILLSSSLAAPVDTLAFQYLAGYLSPAAFSLEVASKLIGVLALWWLVGPRRTHPA